MSKTPTEAKPKARAKTKAPAPAKVAVKAKAETARTPKVKVPKIKAAKVTKAEGKPTPGTPRRSAGPKRKDPVTGLRDVVLKALNDGKGIDVVVLDVRKLCSFTDTMVVVTGNTGRQVNALAQRVLEAALSLGVKPIGSEGRESNEWVLIDFADIVVHVMQKDARQLYELEKLWSELPTDGETSRRS